MRRRLVILTEIISPYRIPLFNDLAQDPDLSLHVIFLAETDPALRQWRVYKEEMRFSHEVLPAWRGRVGRTNLLLNRGVWRAMTEASPDAVLCGGYNYVASWQALWWARTRNVPFLLWSESNRYDARRGRALVEILKTEFLRNCSGFVVPGQAADAYLRDHKVRQDRIFVAPNAVDNDLFSSLATAARQRAMALRRELGLPDRYFLFVGRLVPEKGVFELLAAYAQLNEQIRREVGLVFVGDGTSRGALQEQADAVAPGVIKFPGFAQREQLPSYYALAEMLVLPTYTDTWGLVVNEAMACGLPVILSRVAGCAPDLVRDDWNGVLISPQNVPSLKSALTRLSSETVVCATMGNHAAQHIRRFSPREWSVGISKAVAAIATHD